VPSGPMWRFSAEALSLLERGLDVGNAHVEQDAPFIAFLTKETGEIIESCTIITTTSRTS
jgi:hypothetical protein